MGESNKYKYFRNLKVLFRDRAYLRTGEQGLKLAEAEVFRHGLPDGGREVLQKPFNAVSLVRRVREVLATREGG